MKHMGLRKEYLTCLSLLLLLMLMIEFKTPCFADGFNKFSRFKGGSVSETNSLKPHRGFKGNNADYKNGDDGVFGAQKRKVYTGPNPLHNR
ncbi:unnamed protein product [Camellia sinensis]